jgi:hypothetical protein
MRGEEEKVLQDFHRIFRKKLVWLSHQMALDITSDEKKNGHTEIREHAWTQKVKNTFFSENVDVLTLKRKSRHPKSTIGQGSVFRKKKKLFFPSSLTLDLHKLERLSVSYFFSRV